MKKLLIIIFLVLGIFFIRTETANASHGTTKLVLLGGVYHNNGSTNWEVAYRLSWINARGDREWHGVWKVWTNKVRNCYGSGMSGTADWCNFTLTGSDSPRHEWNSCADCHPSYRMQWGTTCIDPKENPVNEANVSGTYVAIFHVNVTSGRTGATNSGRDVAYAYGNSISGRTDACPFPPTYEIDGYVFVDENRDGNRDGGEPYYNTGNTAVDKFGDSFEDTGTNSNGYFRFYNLPARSDYGIRLNVPSGYVCTTSNGCTVGCQSQGCGSSGINLPPDRTYYFGIAPDRADLIVSSFTYPGGSTAVATSDPTVVVRNRGYRAVTGAFTVRVCNGNGACRTSNPINQNIAPGDSYSVSSQFQNMPRPQNPGNYTARATVDYGNDITEADEGNNTRDDAYTTTRPAPDLVVSSFRYPGGNENATSNPTVVIRNQGTAIARGPFRVRVNYGGGGTGPNGIRTTTVNQDLDVGDSLDVSALVPAPFAGMAIPPARNAVYTARATVDVADDVNETNENNNTRDDDYRSTDQPLPDLEIVTFRYLNPSGTITAPAGSTTNPTITIRNTGDVSATQDFDVRICNGYGSCRLERVTQSIPVSNTSTNISALFTGMPVPSAVANFTAAAIVDYGDVVNELNDGNNREEFDYSTTGSALSTHTISGGLFDDSVIKNGIKDPGENYINGTFQITGTNGFVTQTISSGATGFTTTRSLTSGQGPYTISLTAGMPAGYEAIYPANPVPPQRVTVNVGSACDAGITTTHRYATCTTADDIINLNFAVAEIPPPAWFQGVGGDIRADQGLVNELPLGTSFNIGGTNLTSGVVFGSPSLNLGVGDRNAKASQNGWLVYDRPYAPSIVKTSYDYILSALEKAGQLEGARELTCTICNLTSNVTGQGVYRSFRSTVISGSYNFTGGDHIFLIDNNLTINNNITVSPGSSAIFIVSGDIRIDSDVTRLEGIYSADGVFSTQGIGDGRDAPLEIHGNVVGNAKRTQNLVGFRNGRNMSEINGNTTPTVSIIFRPDLILNAPDIIRSTNYKIQELAPGQD